MLEQAFGIDDPQMALQTDDSKPLGDENQTLKQLGIQ